MSNPQVNANGGVDPFKKYTTVDDTPKPAEKKVNSTFGDEIKQDLDKGLTIQKSNNLPTSEEIIASQGEIREADPWYKSAYNNAKYHTVKFVKGFGEALLGGTALALKGAAFLMPVSCTSEKVEIEPPTEKNITEIITGLNGENPKINGEDAKYVVDGDKVKLQWGDGYSIDCNRSTQTALQKNPMNKMNTALQTIGVNTGVTNPAIVTDVDGGQNSWSGIPMLGMENLTKDFNANSLSKMQVKVAFPKIAQDGLLEMDDNGNHVVNNKQATISDASGKYSLLNASGEAVGKNDTAFVIKAEDGEEYLVQTQDQRNGEYGLNGDKVLVYYRKDGNDYKQAFMAAKGWTNGTVDIQQNDGFSNNTQISAQGYDGLSDKLNACIMKLSFTHGIGVTVD